MLGMYFFAADYRIEHSRQVYTFTRVLSETGGMASSLFSIFGIMASIFNYYVYVMHFVHLLYFVRDEQATEKSGFLSKSGNALSQSFVLRSSAISDIESPIKDFAGHSDSAWSDEEVK